MQPTKGMLHVILPLAMLAGMSLTAAAQSAQGLTNAPAGFIPPPLHPAGAQLETKQLAPGVYALLSNKPPVDNSGFVVGERGVLVIDSHINGAMARQIQEAVRRVTSKPILYLVNTNYHGDHTFGNYAFPATTQIVAHRKTAEKMRHFDTEKKFLLQTVNGDKSVYGDAELRLPDVVFDDYLRLDLGGRVVELYHFGPGNTPGDTVVYVPEAKAAWTGNLVLGNGSIPFLIEGGADRYLQTISRFASTLEVDTIIPGHAGPGTAAMFDRYLSYLSCLLQSVRGAVQAGKSLEETLAATPLGERFLLPEPFRSQVGPFFTGVHRFNVQKTYLELNGGTK